MVDPATTDGTSTQGHTNSTILSVENLRKVHAHADSKDELVVLDRVSFHVNEGEFVTIIGPSGCGKTTLLNIVAGMETYNSGTVTVMGGGAGSPREGALIIFQEDSLFPWLTVVENVAFGLRNKGLAKAERLRVANEYVEMVQLG